ncbi:MAG: M24 family metallopeptidase [Pseudomonadota bacterium]
MPRFSPALTYGPASVEWQERINFERLRAQRAERMKDIMKKHNIPALLATGASNIRYLTGLTGPDFAPGIWYVLFFAESEPVVFAHAGYIYHYMQECPWISEFRLARSWLNGICGPEATAEEADKFATGIAEEIARRGLKDEPLALMGFDGTAQSALHSKGLKVRSGSSLMLEASARKTEDELRCIKMVVAIAETAWYKVMEHLKPGVMENELSLIGREAISKAGADIAKVGFRSGPLTFERGMKDTARIIQAGEILYGNLCSTRYMGYGACLYRTFFVGEKPGQRENDWYKRLLERIDAVIDAIRPGATTADAARHFSPASNWGYEDELSVLTIEIGHGLGLRQYEMPVINRQWSFEHPQVFEPGMVIAIESREGETGQGAVRLENMVIVTERGAEIIDRFPREHITAVPF